MNINKPLFLSTILLTTSQLSFAQDMSTWSDKTVCRLANSQPDNSIYHAEAKVRKLDCNTANVKTTNITPSFGGHCYRQCKEFRQYGEQHFGTRSTSGFKQHTNHQKNVRSHNFKLITDPDFARRGKQYQRFELRNGDCYSDGGWNDCSNDRQRAEYSAKPNQQPKGKQCYAFSLKLDESFVDIYPTKTSLGQIHQTGGPKGTAGGLKSFPPLIQFNADYGIYAFGWHELSGSASNVTDIMHRYTLAEVENMLGVWTDISFCLDFTNDNMSVWVNGKLKHSIDKSPINFMPKEIYFKHGIYQSFISEYKFVKDTDTTPTQIVYYDEIRRGNSIEDVDFHINPDLKPID